MRPPGHDRGGHPPPPPAVPARAGPQRVENLVELLQRIRGELPIAVTPAPPADAPAPPRPWCDTDDNSEGDP